MRKHEEAGTIRHTTVIGGSLDPERRAHDLVAEAIEAYHDAQHRDHNGSRSSAAIDRWFRACRRAGAAIPSGWKWGISLPPVPPAPTHHDDDPFRRCEACAAARVGS